MANSIEQEIGRRRTFAIISHPDAGKTTLTEKFLLYGGAINTAGSVKGKANSKHAVSDWMEIEKERGISVTSSVLQFEYEGKCINILDTPGHEDFSEDTYRTLMAADCAVMVIDASKGVEPQTIKLFKVCVMRHIPIFTFINKRNQTVFLYLLLTIQAKQLLYFKLYRETMGIPACLTRNHAALHCAVSGDHVFDDTGQYVADMRLAVGSWRSVIKHIRLASFTHLDALFKNVFICPELFYFFFPFYKL